MRITVGGVLFMAGTGAFVALGPLRIVTPSLSSQGLNLIESSERGVDWMMGLIKGRGEVQKEAELPPLPVAETPFTKAIVLEPEAPTPAIEAVETAAAPKPLKIVAEPEPKIVPRKQRRRSAVRRKGNALSIAPMATGVNNSKAVAKPASVAKATTAKPAAKSAGKPDPLIGVYVSLKLKTGREVRGVLQDKSATHYTLELPGMGPFQYPMSNVVSVTQAE